MGGSGQPITAIAVLAKHGPLDGICLFLSRTGRCGCDCCLALRPPADPPPSSRLMAVLLSHAECLPPCSYHWRPHEHKRRRRQALPTPPAGETSLTMCGTRRPLATNPFAPPSPSLCCSLQPASCPGTRQPPGLASVPFGLLCNHPSIATSLHRTDQDGPERRQGRLLMGREAEAKADHPRRG